MNLETDFNLKLVTAPSARAWAEGRISDSALDEARPEILYLNELGNRASYPACLAAILRLIARHHCPAAIAHSCSEIMTRHYLKWGGVITYREQILWRGQSYPAARIVIPPPAWAAWLKGRERFQVQGSRFQGERAEPEP